MGVSYSSLSNLSFCPSASSSFFEFMQNCTDTEKSKFSAFTQENTEFSFGSSKIKLYNWELFDTQGKIWNPEVSQSIRETVSYENNNSLALTLTQGNKIALFTGDMNNLDEDVSTGRVGDEDRLKDQIGDVDFLKLGHHGYQYSNTPDFLATIKPEYAVITNDDGNGYRSTLDWLNDHHVDYLYSTSDENAVVATITENDVYLNFETTNQIKTIQGKVYYLPEYDKSQFVDWHTIALEINYSGTETFEVSSWEELKETIDQNKIDISTSFQITELMIRLKQSDHWMATSTIEIAPYQRITLTTDEDILMKRDVSLASSSLMKISGTLNLGTKSMIGQIILDGNKENVSSTDCLIDLELGTLNIEDKVILQNNKRVQDGRYGNLSSIQYGAPGSAIFSNHSTITMYGGEIIHNENHVVSTINYRNAKLSNYVNANSIGAGIYLSNDSLLTMYGGKINYNRGENHSSFIVSGTTYGLNKKGFSAQVNGVGIHASHSNLNLQGGEVSYNVAQNDSKVTLSDNTQLYTLNQINYGIGIYSTSTNVVMKNVVSTKNESISRASTVIDASSSVSTTFSMATRGGNLYFSSSDVTISDCNISSSRSDKTN